MVHMWLLRSIQRDTQDVIGIKWWCILIVLPPFPQFLTFAERLGNVNIDIIHRIDRTASYDEVRQCYTKQSSSIQSDFF